VQINNNISINNETSSQVSSNNTLSDLDGSFDADNKSFLETLETTLDNNETTQDIDPGISQNFRPISNDAFFLGSFDNLTV
jgi:hypothetical protein